MPEKWVVDYYNQIADKILPFFKDRDIDVNQIFDGNNVFRRHEKDGKKWIRINSKKDLRIWTDWHVWSFYPHLEGDHDTWFALDIDPNKTNFECVKIASFELANILEELKLEYLIKFSGNKGFHFLFSIGNVGKELPGEKLWTFERKLVSFLQNKLENRLQENKNRNKFYQFLKKDDPITITQSAQKDRFNSIILDEQILHEKANIRSPYSLHEKTQLVSLPIYKDQIMDFKPQKDANPKNTDQFRLFKLPQNSFSEIVKTIQH